MGKLNLRSEKTLKLDFQKYCACAESENATEKARKAFEHKAYDVKENIRNDSK